MHFIYEYKYVGDDYPPAYWFLFCRDEVLTEEVNGSLRIPFFPDIRELGLEPENVEYIGSADGRDCYAASVKDAAGPAGYSFHKLLPAYEQMDEAWFWITGRAFHMLGWSNRTRFCSVCGSRMAAVAEERARQCSGCGARVYPRISPAVIVAVLRDDRILLARASKFATPMHSVIAGFVEPGETLEACVRREVMEEVGIEIKNIRYFGSQPWPFPDSLMIAFTAEYSSGTLKADHNEILEAGWYGAQELPQIPGKASVARKLIDWFVREHKG
jgi:NAD+ diphosphatase